MRRGGRPKRPGVAVAKVVRWHISAEGARAMLESVLAKADRAEDDWGQAVSSPDEVIETWRLRDDDGRTAMHLVFSLPNQDPRAEWEAAQAAALELFHDSPHVCALRTDTRHVHVHVLVRARDYYGRKLRVNPPALRRYREVLARAGRAQGIPVEARTCQFPRPRAEGGRP